MDAEGAEDTPDAQAAVTAMLERHTAIPLLLFWTQRNPVSGFSPEVSDESSGPGPAQEKGPLSP